jgi:ornithine cyclodeaminase/alanine dehydrogenase-like protein (mu-crystallin family)
MTPLVLMDGTALTTLRTPAQSALAVRTLVVTEAATLVVFGTGPQALGHVLAIRSIRTIRRVTVVGRNLDHAASLVDRLRDGEVDAVAGSAEAVRSADVIVCATTARQPLFDGHLLADHACVVAVGSHEPDARELDDTVFERASRVVVEERAVALREAGDIIQAIAAEALSADRLTDVADLSGLPHLAGIGVFKGVGMGWQDLAVAEAACAAWQLNR